MRGKILNYYAAGNTAKGFYSLYDSVLDGLDRLFILKGGPGTGKSTLIKAIGQHMVAKGIDIEYVHCASDNDSVDGVLIPQYKIGIVDGMAPHVIEPKAPGVLDEYVHLGGAWDREKLISNKSEILTLSEEISGAFQSAYEAYGEALRIHHEIERIYIGQMDFSSADELTEEVIGSIYVETKKKGQKGKIKRRFLGAATPKGAVDFIPNLTEGLKNRYFIKGRAGSGKSTMLKKIADKGIANGYDVEMYHCGFDPESIDMVIIREESVAVFDATGPHEYFPSEPTDAVIDIYTHCFPPGTDEQFASEIKAKTTAYKVKIKKANSYLAKAKKLRDKLESYYIKAMDFKKVEEIQQTLLNEILAMVD